MSGKIEIKRYIPGSINQVDNQCILIHCAIETMRASFVYTVIKCDDVYIKERGCFGPLLVSKSLAQHMQWMMDFLTKLEDVRDFSITLYSPTEDESGVVGNVWAEWQKGNLDE